MRRQFLSSSGLEERQPDPRKEHLHIYCLHWIMGLADSSETLQSPPVPPPSNTHTHTPQLLSPKALRCGWEASAQLRWREITFEAVCYLWRIRLYWPGEMTRYAPTWWWGYRNPSTQTHTHTHKQVTWRCTQLTGCFDTELKADLAGWLRLSLYSSCPSTPTCILLLNTVKFSPAWPVTAVERQPVLSVLSALAFSWLGEMPISILHQYPFIAITLCVFFFSWLTQKTQRWKQ